MGALSSVVSCLRLTDLTSSPWKKIGFKSKSPTMLQLLRLVERITMGFKDHQSTLASFLDFTELMTLLGIRAFVQTPVLSYSSSFI